MQYGPKLQRRRSIRLSKYDYSQAGWYFVTICSKDRQCLFGNIVNGKMVLSGIGQEAAKCWEEIPNHFPNVSLDEYVVMPNHVHGIIRISKTQDAVGVQDFEPLPNPMHQFQKTIPKSLGSIIRGYKIGVTKSARKQNPDFILWQRNYYEHIIRDEEDLNRIREYIIYNPAKWSEDIENTHYREKLLETGKITTIKNYYTHLFSGK